jgi:hypothetical protein
MMAEVLLIRKMDLDILISITAVMESLQVAGLV